MKDLESAPEGGPVTKWLLGTVIPLVILGLTLKAWNAGAVLFLGKGRYFLSGTPAIAMVCGYAGLALFVHFHWFQALDTRLAGLAIPGKCLAALLFLGGYGWAAFSMIRV